MEQNFSEDWLDVNIHFFSHEKQFEATYQNAGSPQTRGKLQNIMNLLFNRLWFSYDSFRHPQTSGIWYILPLPEFISNYLI